MSDFEFCSVKIKGGLRCGKPLLPGKKYCADHVPVSNPPKPKPNKGKMFNPKWIKTSGKRYQIGSWGNVKNAAVRSWLRNKEQDYLAGVEKNEGKEGYVYIFSLGGGFYKIGRTTDVGRRLIALRAGNPNITCIWSAHVTDMIEAETRLHRIFKKKKIEREIYKLEKGDTLVANNAMLKRLQQEQ